MDRARPISLDLPLTLVERVVEGMTGKGEKVTIKLTRGQES